MKKYKTVRDLAKIRKQLADVEATIDYHKNPKLLESLGEISVFTLECIHRDLNDFANYEEVIDKLEHINKDIPKNSYFKDLLEAFKLQYDGKKFIGIEDAYAKYINKTAKKISHSVKKNRNEMQTSDLWKSILHFYLDEKKYKCEGSTMTKRELKNYDELASRSLTWNFDMMDDSKSNLKKVLKYIEENIEILKLQMKFNRKYDHHANAYIVDFIASEKSKAIKKRILKHL